MDDDRLASELQRRAAGGSPRPDWAQRDLLPAVWREVDARPQPVVTSRWSPGWSVVAVIAALLILIVAVPRAVGPSATSSRPPSAGASGSQPTNSSQPSASAAPIDCAANGFGLPVTVLDQTGLVTSCQSLEVPFGEMTQHPGVTNPGGDGSRLRVIWGTSGCVNRATVQVARGNGLPVHLTVDIAESVIVPGCAGPYVLDGFELALREIVSAANVTVFNGVPQPTPSATPEPTPSDPAGRTLQCGGSGTLSDPAITITDHSGLVDSCTTKQADTTPPDSIGVAATDQPNRVLVSWASCSPSEPFEFWGPVEQPIGPARYVMELLRLNTGAWGPWCEGAARDVVVEFSESMPPANILAMVDYGVPDGGRSNTASTSSFGLLLEAPQDGLVANSPITISSTLTYVGSEDSVTLSGSWMPNFGFVSLTGGPSLHEYGSDLMCPDPEVTLSPGDSVNGRLVGPQSVTPEDPNYEYRREYTYDGQFRLPAGTYLIYAVVDLNVGSSCSGDWVWLRDFIVVTVR